MSSCFALLSREILYNVCSCTERLGPLACTARSLVTHDCWATNVNQHWSGSSTILPMASRQLVYKMLSTPACNQYDDATIRTFLADVDIGDGRYTGQGAPPPRRYVIELLMRGSSLGVCSMQMPCMLFDVDLPWANVLEQTMEKLWG